MTVALPGRPDASISAAARIRGCLLGGAIGDALGAGIEFAPSAQIREKHGPAGVTDFVPAYGRPNAITDDTQLTLFTVAALLAPGGPGTLSQRLWRQYRAWARHQHGSAGTRQVRANTPLERCPSMVSRRAPGYACLTGLRSHRRGTVAWPVNPAGDGCGAVMRSAPFGLAAATPEQAWRDALTGAVLTHGHPHGYYPAAALALMICEVRAGTPLPAAAGSALARLRAEGAPARPVASALAAAIEQARRVRPTPQAIEGLGGGWTGEQALAIAVYVALSCSRLEGANMRGALLAAVNHSGDSDSTGSLCGALLGAAYGDAALPAEWSAEVEAASLIVAFAEQLSQRVSDERRTEPAR